MKSSLNLSGRRRVIPIRQSEAAECGLAALAMIAVYHGFVVNLPSMRMRFNTSMKGMTLTTIIRIAEALNLSSRPVRCTMSELKDLKLPALLHWGGNHFVVLERIAGRKLLIHDPASGSEKINLERASGLFTGIALELTPSPEFRPRRVKNPLKLNSLLRISPSIIRGLTQSLVLSVVIELLLLTTPFYLQLVVDDAVVKGDKGFLGILALGFSAILMFRVGANTIRSLTLQFVTQSLSLDMQSRVYHHLIRLPLEWFHKRNVGDIQSRFGAIQPIQSFISNGAIAGLLDGILGSLVLVIMSLYSLILTLVVVVSIILYLCLRLAMLQLQRKVAGDTIITQAKEQTRFLESLRAIETIKAAGAETMREGQQKNAIAAVVNALIRSGNVQIGYSAVAQSIEGFTDIIVIYLGAVMVMDKNMTVGMLMAFLAYKQQFGSRLTNLIEQFIAWNLLSVDLERLSDITLSPMELPVSGSYTGPALGAVDIRAVTFSYCFGEKAVIRQVSLSIPSGQFIAITGPSGCGKSTLIKLITGLYHPGAGSILLDGRPLSQWDIRSLRSQVAIVSQDDNLLAGSVAENIALFDELTDMNLVKSCASAAQIHQEIEAMPMGYETLVGDLGSSLSGGQKQRLLIARALYRRPMVLILDEGTSHLDMQNERAINSALGEMSMTRIVVAHRPETINAASRRVHMVDGQVVFDSTATPVPGSI